MSSDFADTVHAGPAGGRTPPEHLRKFDGPAPGVARCL